MALRIIVPLARGFQCKEMGNLTAIGVIFSPRELRGERNKKGVRALRG